MTTFEATCEKCSSGQSLDKDEQLLRIKDNGSFVCDDCGGTMPRDLHPVPSPVSLPEPEVCACDTGEGPLPEYFRRCPDCPIQS